MDSSETRLPVTSTGNPKTLRSEDGTAKQVSEHEHRLKIDEVPVHLDFYNHEKHCQMYKYCINHQENVW